MRTPNSILFLIPFGAAHFMHCSAMFTIATMLWQKQNKKLNTWCDDFEQRGSIRTATYFTSRLLRSANTKAMRRRGRRRMKEFTHWRYIFDRIVGMLYLFGVRRNGNHHSVPVCRSPYVEVPFLVVLVSKTHQRKKPSSMICQARTYCTHKRLPSATNRLQMNVYGF